MSMLTFDTLKYTERLRAAGVTEAQAKAEAEALRDALSEALDTTLAAKSDIDGIERKLIGHDGKFTLLQWMIGFNLAFTMAVLWKVFS